MSFDVPSLDQVFHFGQHFVFWSTISSVLLPPIELFDSFPRFQKVYRVVVHIVQYYAALNLRGKIAQSYINHRNNNGGKTNATP